jgi:hypothetical protein
MASAKQYVMSLYMACSFGAHFIGEQPKASRVPSFDDPATRIARRSDGTKRWPVHCLVGREVKPRRPSPPSFPPKAPRVAGLFSLLLGGHLRHTNTGIAGIQIRGRPTSD